MFFQVGGEFFETVLNQMNSFGRVSICGCISQYNLLEPPKGINNPIYVIIYILIIHICIYIVRPISGLILGKQLTVQGFMVYRWLSSWPAAFKEIAQWIAEVLFIRYLPCCCCKSLNFTIFFLFKGQTEV